MMANKSNKSYDRQLNSRHIKFLKSFVKTGKTIFVVQNIYLCQE